MLFFPVFSSCRKDDTDTTAFSDALLSARYVLDDSEMWQPVFDWQNIEITHYTSASMSGDQCTFGCGCILGDLFGRSPFIEVSFLDIYSGDCARREERFHHLFPVGNWSFGNTHGKVRIDYYDGKQLWYTANGPQPVAHFTIE